MNKAPTSMDRFSSREGHEEEAKEKPKEGKDEIIEIAFLYDCTGSMQKHINSINLDLKKILNDVSEIYSQSRLRSACVAYKDHTDENGLLSFIDFTEEKDKLTTFVETLKFVNSQSFNLSKFYM